MHGAWCNNCIFGLAQKKKKMAKRTTYRPDGYAAGKKLKRHPFRSRSPRLWPNNGYGLLASFRITRQNSRTRQRRLVLDVLLLPRGEVSLLRKDEPLRPCQLTRQRWKFTKRDDGDGLCRHAALYHPRYVHTWDIISAIYCLTKNANPSVTFDGFKFSYL